MPQLRTELLKTFVASMKQESTMVFAAVFAVAVHGYVRATKDIDILICRDSLESAATGNHRVNQRTALEKPNRL